MAATAGYNALFKLGPTTYATVTGTKSVELQIGLDIYDVTDLNSNTFKKKIAGLADYTLKLSGNFDLTDAQQTALQASTITTPGQTVTWKLFPTGTGSAYAGTAIIKQQGVKIDVKSEEQISWDLEGSGPVTYS